MIASDTGSLILEEIQDTTNLEPGKLKQLADQFVEKYVPELIAFGINVLLGILIYFVGRKIIKWVRKLVMKYFEKVGIDKSISHFVDALSNILLTIILILFVIEQIGFSTTSFIALLGSAGLAVGLALQGTLSNFAGGVLILFFKPFRVGDYIIEDNHKNEGTVKGIELFYTRLRTIDNKEIIIPNGTLANSSLTNVTAQDKRRLDISIGIGYQSDLRKAKQILEQILENEPAVMKDEEHIVVVDELSMDSVILMMHVWVATSMYWPVRWKFLENIKEQFEQAGVEIPHRQLDVNVISDRQE